jgi:6-phospho-beta-glucosidase
MNRPEIIAVLGGGSVWTPYLLQQLAELPFARDLQISLQGPTESHLHEVADFTRSLIGDRLETKVTISLEDAMRGAKIVLNQVRIGGWPARLDDEVLPVQLGGVGDESLGLGGLRAAIRTWPFVIKTSRAILKYAPEAWLLNLTNPSDLISRAWREAGCKRVVSLCDYPQNFIREMSTLAERPDVAPRFNFLGMTHVGWLMPPPGLQLHHLIRKRPELTAWIQNWQALPTPWRIHLADPVVLARRQREAPGHRARQLQKLVEHLWEAIRERDTARYSEFLQERLPTWYTEVVTPAIRGLLGGEPARLIVGLPNNGRLFELNPDVQVETWAMLNDDGIHPEPLLENVPCQEDIVHFGETRALAFAVMIHPRSDILADYARSDPFVRYVTSQADWQQCLEINGDPGT